MPFIIVCIFIALIIVSVGVTISLFFANILSNLEKTEAEIEEKNLSNSLLRHNKKILEDLL